MKPHEGAQAKLFLLPEDGITIIAGACGSGKTSVLLMRALELALREPGWTGALVRKSREQHGMPGGLERESLRGLYSAAGGMYSRNHHNWIFPNGSKIDMMAVETTTSCWDGMRYNWIGGDQLDQWSPEMFLEVESHVRNSWWTCTPTPGSWLALWLDAEHLWYIEATLPGGQRARYRALVHKDNPSLSRSYLQQLEDMPPKEYRRRVLGSWDES